MTRWFLAVAGLVCTVSEAVSPSCSQRLCVQLLTAAAAAAVCTPLLLWAPAFSWSPARDSISASAWADPRLDLVHSAPSSSHFSSKVSCKFGEFPSTFWAGPGLSPWHCGDYAHYDMLKMDSQLLKMVPLDTFGNFLRCLPLKKKKSIIWVNSDNLNNLSSLV